MRGHALLLAGCIILASCGGDGGGGTSAGSGSGGNSTSASPPTTATLNTGEIKPTADATYISATLDLTTSGGTTNQTTNQTTGGSTSDRTATIDTPQFVGTYSAQAGYHLADAINSATFGPAQLVSNTPASMQNPTVLFATSTATTQDYLALYKESVNTTSNLGSGSFTPKYGGVGGWQHTVPTASSKLTRVDYFAFGPATPVAAMPKSGIVKFWVSGSGNYATDSDLFFNTQGSEVDVDFGAGTISGTLLLSGQNLYANETGGLTGGRVQGAIVGNSVDAAISSDVADISGRFHLLFVGPNADELILTYVEQDGSSALVGSSVGVRDPYL